MRDRRIVAESVKFEGYVARQRREAERVRSSGAVRSALDRLSRAAGTLPKSSKLEAVRPETLGRAARIDGMTPPALALLAIHISGLRRAGLMGCAQEPFPWESAISARARRRPSIER
jgi:tRNA uridine 5-carboxymethylaminomethyl modification enzyme